MLIGILFGIFCASAGAEIRTNNLAPLADAFVRDGAYAQTNFGTASILELKTGAVGTKRDVYLKFDLNGVWKIESATLRFFAALAVRKPTALSTTAYGVTDTNWTETGITWNNRPDL
ncbi:MAG: CBM96 family carbohydrate-binding protein, partial [Verrucomicrobiota bacterium]